jgi:hypothetical protein
MASAFEASGDDDKMDQDDNTRVLATAKCILLSYLCRFKVVSVLHGAACGRANFCMTDRQIFASVR